MQCGTTPFNKLMLTGISAVQAPCAIASIACQTFTWRAHQGADASPVRWGLALLLTGLHALDKVEAALWQSSFYKGRAHHHVTKIIHNHSLARPLVEVAEFATSCHHILHMWDQWASIDKLRDAANDLVVQPSCQPALQEAHMHQGPCEHPVMPPHWWMRHPPHLQAHHLADDPVILQADDSVILQADDPVSLQADDPATVQAHDPVKLRADDAVIRQADQHKVPIRIKEARQHCKCIDGSSMCKQQQGMAGQGRGRTCMGIRPSQENW
ncbi:MAG: hypothetical protein FRX49_04432 [Trebouxia sp. A1-2]|nr:MAG: hypothetical protein FRX49_04432 [Trebouxia sp. A1-2]